MLSGSLNKSDIMARYLALPNELKDLIPLSNQDIARLSQTSKAMRAALVPRLYKRISMHWEAFETPPPISGVVMAILRSPDIAESVEEIDLCGKNYRESFYNPDYRGRFEKPGTPEYFCEKKPKLDRSFPDCIPLLEKATHSMKLSQKQYKWILGSEDALDFVIAAVIVHCPNLKVLHLDSAFVQENRFLGWVLSHYLGIYTGDSPSVLTKLEKVQIAKHVSWKDLKYRQGVGIGTLLSCLPFFYIPSLEVFSVPLPNAGFVTTLSDLWSYKVLPISNIQRLDLHHTRLKTLALTYLLAQTPRLKSLVYDHWYFGGDPGSRYDCTELRRALELVGHTLEELVISVEPYDGECPDRISEATYLKDDKGLESLSFMLCLIKLETSLPILLGWTKNPNLRLGDSLPRSLEEFCIRDDFVKLDPETEQPEEITAQIRGWLETKAWKKSTPNIKEIRLTLRDYYNEWSLEARKTVVGIGETEGLQCWYDKYPG